MTNILFICSRNQWRSPTAEQVYRKTPGVSVRSAGTSAKSRRRVSGRDIDWADLIFVMEEKHKSRMRADFPRECQYAKFHILDIPDEYNYGDLELIELIKSGTHHYLNN